MSSRACGWATVKVNQPLDSCRASREWLHRNYPHSTTSPVDARSGTSHHRSYPEGSPMTGLQRHLEIDELILSGRLNKSLSAEDDDALSTEAGEIWYKLSSAERSTVLTHIARWRTENEHVPLPHDKICPKCNSTFSCVADESCWCMDIKLSKETLNEIKATYPSCLCQSCLRSYFV